MTKALRFWLADIRGLRKCTNVIQVAVLAYLLVLDHEGATNTFRSIMHAQAAGCSDWLTQVRSQQLHGIDSCERRVKIANS